MIGYCVTTFEWDDRHQTWKRTLSHIFWGDTLREAKNVARSHLEVDRFFRESWTGKFKWHHEILRVKNSQFQITSRSAGRASA